MSEQRNVHGYLSSVANRNDEEIGLFQQPECAGMAQLVEQLTCNQQVVGSSPIASSKKPRYLYRGFLFLDKYNFSKLKA